MELFSEIYGCYYTVVSEILRKSEKGMTKGEIEELVSSRGFYESTFHLIPSLFSDEWNLLAEKNGKYYSKLNVAQRPLTNLEKSWLKALLSDKRMKLFLDEEFFDELQQSLAEVEPLYSIDDFHVFDKHLDGDDYENAEYISRFKIILKALKENHPLMIEYDSPKSRQVTRQYHPYKLNYSMRDDKFRLQCAAFSKRKNQLERFTLNLARITSVQFSENNFDISDKLAELYKEKICTEPIVIEISKERNAIERCMLQFASFERQTEYDRERDIYTCRIWYNAEEETELLIRILSFGPVVKVLSPDEFLNQVKERIKKQMALNKF